MRPSLALVVALAAPLAGCGMVNARVIDKDGKQYNLDGTAREQPAERARKAIAAMDVCSDEARAAERGFTQSAVPAFLAVASAPRGDAAIAFADADPIVRVDESAKPKAKAKKSRAAAPPPAPYEPATAALSTAIRGALDATDHCSAANLNAIKVVWDEQRYHSQPQTHELLESHWRATQRLARSKELAVTAVALGLALRDAGRGKAGSMNAIAAQLGSSDPPLFADVPFDHDLRREVLLQALRDTNDSCGKKDADGKTPCDAILGVVKQASNAVDAVKDVQAGRILAALDKASRLADGGASQDAQDRARREAVIALIPETPARDTLDGVLARARDGRAHDARALGSTLASSDGVARLLTAAEK